MLLKENATNERLMGSYYTPIELADYVTKWAIKGQNIRRVLEPSCGDGIFLKCIRNRNLEDRCNITAIEIDTEASVLAGERITGSTVFNDYEQFLVHLESNHNLKHIAGCSVINDDFYKIYDNGLRQEVFDVIVGNPPYIRYQYLTEEQREEQSVILTANGMKSNKLINAWVSFVVACVQMLDVNGKIGLIIPAELMQVAYAEDLRNFLMSKLQKTTIITFRELVFPDVEQEVILLLGEKDLRHNDEHKLKILQYDNIAKLIQDDNMEAIEFNDVEEDDSKWTRYFLSASENELISNIRQDNRFIQLSDIADVDIGITTGNNDYFCVNRDKVNEYGLENACIPLIARSVNINGIRFTKQDWEENINLGAKTYLIDFPDIPYEEYPEGFVRYIRYGEETNQNSGYKCQIRKRWYRIPSIWVPDAFFLRRNHLYPKFVLNTELNAVSTDTMHRIRFSMGVNPKRVLLSYYNSIALAFTEIEGRSYGGGVLEILPGEVEKIILPDLRKVELVDEETVNELVEIIDGYVRNHDDIQGILDEIDRRVLVNILGIDENVILAFRNMWLTLRDRRLNRKSKKVKQHD